MNTQPNVGAWTAISRDWKAQMISPLADEGQGHAASFVALDFVLDAHPNDAHPGDAGPERAELFISALGLYRCFINGRRVGEDVLTPGFTNYDQRLAYQTYDVAPLLRTGDNRIEIWLADGWYRSQLMWGDHPIFNCWGDRIGAIAEIVGPSGPIVVTDATWSSGPLPILRSGIYFGEVYDAREPAMVPTAGTQALPFDLSVLIPQETPPPRELAPIEPIACWTDADGRRVFDFGQNVAGYVRYAVRGQSGAVVLTEYSEVLGPERFFDNRNYRSAVSQNVYTLNGEADAETYAPHFTFHGFRYARLTVTGEAEILSIVSVPISSITELAGDFHCGHPQVNRLVQNTIWSQRGNFIEIPTDCPQRDERLGWTGDAQVFAATACWLADCRTFLRKFLRDVMADQRPDGAIAHVSPDPTRLHPQNFQGFAGSTGWGDAIVVIPWVLYTHYADRDALRECLDAMVRWVDFVWSISNGPVVRPPARWGERGFTFGDWLQPTGGSVKPRPTIADDCAATLYHFISTDLLARIAGVLGEDALKARMEARAEAIRKAFAFEFIAPSGRLAHSDQTSYALAFLHDLVPARHVETAKAQFRRIVEDAEYKIGTGFIGTPALLPALTKLGMDDVAEKVFLQTEVPGWMYQVNQGATTIWERWDAMAPDGSIFQPDMNSYNHYSYGAVCQWLFESVAGVAPDPERPGFARVLIDPAPIAALSPVSAFHDTAHGRIVVGWSVEEGRVDYRLTLPEGSSGLFRPGARHGNPVVDGRPVSGEVHLPAGSHRLTFDLPTTSGT